MKRNISLTTLTFLAISGLAQFTFGKDEPAYSAQDAAKHIGETATVTDKVDDAYQAKGGNIFLNLGGRHPNEAFTVFIAATNADAFKDFKSYEGKTISVTGKIEDHKGKPEISVKSSSDITVKDNSAAATAASPAATAAATATP
jgi:DNA/RNA endonuclease YhcR with UshA esterase domain